ncbi:anti-sigma factor domain-containing protein [Virgibacillus xinjiangensis]|uniref:Anti-sigma factor domain-containing protein n=1 Tax=Virgibacillus xinjiangensis TaxID=393090 RepID=A0ABV7CQW7_9BACI
MPKGIIMEHEKKCTIILTRDGTFQKAAPIKDAHVGMEVSFEPLTEPPRSLSGSQYIRLLAIASILLLAVFPVYFLTQAEKSYAYVNLAINPSIELEIGEAFQVKGIRAINEDARNIVDNLTDYQHEKLDKVIARIIEEGKEAGIIQLGEERSMLIGISYISEHRNDPSLDQNIEKFIKDEETNWNIASFQVPRDWHEEAMEENRSMNEIMADVLENQEEIPEDTADSLSEEDIDIIHSYYGEEKETSATEQESANRQESKEEEEDPVSGPVKHPSERKEQNAEGNKTPPSAEKDRSDSANNREKTPGNHANQGQSMKGNSDKAKEEPKGPKRGDERNNDHPPSEKNAKNASPGKGNNNGRGKDEDIGPPHGKPPAKNGNNDSIREKPGKNGSMGKNGNGPVENNGNGRGGPGNNGPPSNVPHGR